MRRRTSGEFSPIPPAKTRVSRPPSAAASAPSAGLGPVAEQLDRLGGPDVGVLPGQEVAEVGAGLRDTEQAGFVIDEVVELVDRQPPDRIRNRTRPGSISPQRVPMTSPEVGVRPIVVSMQRPSRTAARLAPEPRWARMTRPSGRLRAGDPGQLLHQIGVGEAVEAVATDPGRLVPPRDRDDLRDARQVVMEGRVEARHLGQLGIEAQERLDRSDLAGQVVGVVGDDPAQLVEDLGRDELRAVEAIASVDDAMTDDGDVLQTDDVSE